jgi:hypothetical protein
MMSINPDAHSIPELDHMHCGIKMTRKSGVPADRVLNAMPLLAPGAHASPETQATKTSASRMTSNWGSAPSRSSGFSDGG